MTYPSGFYVYRLVDPVNGLPFYVGKGRGDRAWQHQRIVARGGSTRNDRKDNKIRVILALGKDVEVEVVAQYDSEADALDHEYRLVEADPTLTNVMPGGSWSDPLVAEKRRQRAKVRRCRREAEAEGRAKRAGGYSIIAPSWLPHSVAPVEREPKRRRIPKPIPQKAEGSGNRRKRRKGGTIRAALSAKRLARVARYADLTPGDGI